MATIPEEEHAVVKDLDIALSSPQSSRSGVVHHIRVIQIQSLSETKSIDKKRHTVYNCFCVRSPRVHGTLRPFGKTNPPGDV